MLEKIRSKAILKKIFINLKKRKELKILKYNKKLMFKLNIQKKDFEDYKILKELNQKYSLNIKDIDVRCLRFEEKNNIEKIFEYINKIEFKELIGLYINKTNLSDIKILERCKFENYLFLNLGDNKISNINEFEKVNFKELKQLILPNNNITKIKVFENCKLEKLERLDLY